MRRWLFILVPMGVYWCILDVLGTHFHGFGEGAVYGFILIGLILFVVLEDTTDRWTLVVVTTEEARLRTRKSACQRHWYHQP